MSSISKIRPSTQFGPNQARKGDTMVPYRPEDVSTGKPCTTMQICGFAKFLVDASNFMHIVTPQEHKPYDPSRPRNVSTTREGPHLVEWVGDAQHKGAECDNQVIPC